MDSNLIRNEFVMTNEITWRLENENIGRLLVHYAIPAVIGTRSGCASYLRIDFDFPDTTLYAGIWNVDRRGSRYKGLHSSRP